MLFDADYYTQINEARWAVARTLIQDLREVAGLSLQTCLDVGSGPGWFAERLVQEGLAVTGIEGRPELVAEAQRRVPQAEFLVRDLDQATPATDVDKRDLVFCFGLLYHVENPMLILRALARQSAKVLLLETQRILSEDPICQFVDENQNTTQGLTYTAVIPSSPFLVKALYRAGYTHVYECDRTVDHDDFRETLAKHRRRVMLVATFAPVQLDGLRHVPEPDAPKAGYNRHVEAPPKHGPAAPPSEAREAAIRFFHRWNPYVLDALPEEAAVAYTQFLRTARESTFPRGVETLREVRIDGARFTVNVGDRLGCDFYFDFYQERFLADVFLGALREGQTFIDVGANFGFYSVAGARRVGSTGRVYAFEPTPTAFALLGRNVEANALANVSPHEVCVGAASGEVDFFVSAEPSFSSLSQTGRAELAEVKRMRAVSIDDFCREHGIQSIDAMKVDVEGFDYAVLLGAKSILDASADVLVMIEVSSKNLTRSRRNNLANVLSDLAGMGFVGYTPSGSSADLLRIEGGQAMVERAEGNLFLVRGGSTAESRLATAARKAAEHKPAPLARLRRTLAAWLQPVGEVG